MFAVSNLCNALWRINKYKVHWFSNLFYVLRLLHFNTRWEFHALYRADTELHFFQNSLGKPHLFQQKTKCLTTRISPETFIQSFLLVAVLKRMVPSAVLLEGHSLLLISAHIGAAWGPQSQSISPFLVKHFWTIHRAIQNQRSNRRFMLLCGICWVSVLIKDDCLMNIQFHTYHLQLWRITQWRMENIVGR